VNSTRGRLFFAASAAKRAHRPVTEDSEGPSSFAATNAAPWKDCEDSQFAKLEPTLFHHGASRGGWRWLKTPRWQARAMARDATALVRIRRRSNCPRACSTESRRPRADGPWRQGPRPATGTPRRRRQRPGEHGPVSRTSTGSPARYRFPDSEIPRGRSQTRQHDQATGTAPRAEKRRGGQAGATSASEDPGGRKL